MNANERELILKEEIHAVVGAVMEVSWEPRMNANERELILKEEIHAVLGAAMEVSWEPRMNANKREWILKEEIHAIVGAAMEVPDELGAGFLEAVYQEALGTIRVHSRPLAADNPAGEP